MWTAAQQQCACRWALQSMLKVIIKAKETGLLERSATFAARFADMTISIAQVCSARYPVRHGIPHGTVSRTTRYLRAPSVGGDCRG